MVNDALTSSTFFSKAPPSAFFHQHSSICVTTSVWTSVIYSSFDVPCAKIRKNIYVELDLKRKFNLAEDFSRATIFTPRSGILRQLFGLNCMLFGQSLTKLPQIIRGYIHINTIHGRGLTGTI